MKVLAAVIVALGCAALAPAASATHFWGDYHWARSNNPFAVNVNNHSTTYAANVTTAISDWNSSSVLDVAAGSGQRQTDVYSGDYGPNGWVGLASISLDSTNHILGGSVYMNDYYLNQSTYSTWKQFVACQEIGHTFGLDHQDTNFYNTNLGTCMDYSLNPQGGGKNGTLDNEHPNQGDYDQLSCIYDPLDFGLTLSTSTHSCVGYGHL